MPIHWPTLSRREFLKRSLLAGAGLTVTPQLLAAARQSDADSWALLADTHIAGDVTQAWRHVNMAEHLNIVNRELLALPRRPAGVFMVGDCAFNRGRKEDYATLVRLLDPLRAGGMPLHLTLGNHDHRENFRQTLELGDAGKGAVPDKLVAIVRGERANWFVLDSLEKTLQEPGRIGEEQLNWLARALDADPRKPALVLAHHNPGREGKIRGLKDTAALFEVLRPRRQVKAYIFGHTHNWKVTQDESGIHLVNLPPVAYVFEEGNPSGWAHAALRNDGMKLELRCVDPAHKDHAKVLNLQWRAEAS